MERFPRSDQDISVFIKFRRWSRSAPFFAFWLVIISLVGSALAPVQMISTLFKNEPVKNFAAFPLFTSWLIPDSMLSGVVQAVFAYPLIQRLEISQGSACFLGYFSALGVAIQLTFAALVIVLNPVGYPFEWVAGQTSLGLWPLLFALLPIEVQMSKRSTPVQHITCLPSSVPALVYLFVLCFIFELGQFRLDIICGLVLGIFVSRLLPQTVHSAQRSLALEQTRFARFFMTSTSHPFEYLSETEDYYNENDRPPLIADDIDDKMLDQHIDSNEKMGENAIIGDIVLSD
eukprot:714219_1